MAFRLFQWLDKEGNIGDDQCGGGDQEGKRGDQEGEGGNEEGKGGDEATGKVCLVTMKCGSSGLCCIAMYPQYN